VTAAETKRTLDDPRVHGRGTPKEAIALPLTLPEIPFSCSSKKEKKSLKLSLEFGNPMSRGLAEHMRWLSKNFNVHRLEKKRRKNTHTHTRKRKK
jgi:hypothetical protein